MRDPRPMLRAEGNLSYLQFIEMVKFLWSQGHPDIPFEPSGNELPAKYPSIIYSVQLTKTHQNESKPRFREVLDNDTDTKYIIAAQRIDYVVTFSAVTEKDPHLADVLIEEFENFIMEFIPLFKREGLSEITYARRLPDREESRPGEGVVWRTTSFMVTIEKVSVTTAEKLRRVHIDVRRMLHQATTYFIANDDDTISVFGQDFLIGDLVHIMYSAYQPQVDGIPPGPYKILNIVVVGESKKYYLGRATTGDPIAGIGAGTGYIYRVEDDVTAEITDQQATPDQDF